MSAQKTQQQQPTLPGAPFVADRKANSRKTIAPGRVLRDRSGRPMLAKNEVEARPIADAATKFTGKPIVLVHFDGKNGKRIEQVGFAVDGGSLAHGGAVAIEAMLFLAQEQRTKSKMKWKALTAPTGKRQ